MELTEQKWQTARRKYLEARGARRKYLEAGGVRCPFCDSEDIEGGFVETDVGGASQRVHCLVCGARWQDSYMLVDVALLAPPEETKEA